MPLKKSNITRIKLRLRDERGVTLVELLVTTLMMLVVMTAIFGLLNSASQVGYGDVDRSAALEQQTVAFRKMINEIRQAYQINCPSGGCSTNASSNYIDFDERITDGTNSAQADRRVSYVCNAVPSASSDGPYECVRFETAATDTADSVPIGGSGTCAACSGYPGGTSGTIYILRVVNTNVFSNLTNGTSPSGATRWISGKATIYTPGAGSLSTKVSQYSHDIILQQYFNMQQLEFGQ
jgi:Tfp pilus assembly protein PilW